MLCKYDDQISQAFTFGSVEDLEKLHIDLVNERKKVGDFIDMFLEKYDSKMQFAPPDDKLWQLFRKKHVEYGQLERCVKSSHYFLSKRRGSTK
jgi:hypothetical protein